MHTDRAVLVQEVAVVLVAGDADDVVLDDAGRARRVGIAEPAQLAVVISAPAQHGLALG